MAGTIIESQLTARAASATRFALATEDDDAVIRRLLRENPMGGEITLSFEREPDYFCGAQIAGAEDQTILGFERGRLFGMGRCSFRERYLNGKIRRVGYLSDLRLDSSAQGRFDLLRRGYRFFHELDRANFADFYFTSVTADNFRSLRFLERGLPGMPVYEPLGDFVTLLIAVPGNARRLTRLKAGRGTIAATSEEHVSALAEFLNSHARQHNLSSVWDERKLFSLERHGLPLADFQLLMNDGKIVACGALWDQRRFRQIVIRGYSRRLGFVRPWLNLFAGVFRAPRLPPVGLTLAHGFLSPLAVSPDDKQALLALVELSLSKAATRGLDYLTLGFAANDPRLETVRSQFRCREYKNRLFKVCWKEANSTGIILNDNPMFPEVALL
jgi:hypothetical protein